MIKSLGELVIYQTRDMASCDKGQLTDLSEIEIDTELAITERIGRFIHQVGNPYLFKVGDTAVKVEFGGSAELSDSLMKLITG